MPVGYLLLLSALCSSGALYASDIATIAVVDVSQQQKGIKGTVKDATGPVVGASVIIKGTTNGTVTDLDGKFELSGLKTGDIIQISYIGYETQEVRYAGQPSLQVTLS